MAKTKQSKEKTFREQVDQVIEMLAEDFNWEAHEESADTYESLDDLFRACCKVGAPSEEDCKKFAACGSVRIEDTPKALYRLLYLLRPAAVDFSDMYKTRLFSFSSSDGRFWVDVDLFKYEVGLYLYAPKESVVGRGSGIIAGYPGADNGRNIGDEDGQRFFEMVKMATNFQWMVYGGNDFEV